MPKYFLVYIRGFVRFLFLLVIGSFSIKPALAIELWIDEFNSIDTSRWTVLNETNTPIIFASEVLFSNISPNKSLFFQNNNILPGGDISIEIGFRYLNNGYNFGNGIAVNDNPTSLRSSIHPGASDWTIFLWPTGGTNFKVFSSICPAVGTCVTDNVYTTVSGSAFSDSHVFKINYLGNKYSLYLDEVFVGETVETSRPPGYIWLGNPMLTASSVSFSSFYVDYVRVSDFSPPVSVFPYLSQKDVAWKDELYDTANLWAPVGNDGIGRWGCAITSTAMVLQENGVKALDGSAVDPSKLNTWLKSQPDGYIGPGLLNWLAITRYAKESYELWPAGSTKLEYERSYVPPTTPNLPAIFGLGSHFVVAHGSEDLNWKINDPNDVLATTLPLTTPLVSVNRFIPSSTDLSYMLFASSDSMNISMSDQLGSAVPLVWTSENLADDMDGSSDSPLIQTALMPKPDDGTYRLQVENPTGLSMSVEVYLYDEDGGVVKDTLVIPANTTAQFLIQYSSTPNLNGVITLDSTAIFDYLKSLRKLKTPANGIFQAIYARFANLFTDMSTAGNLNKFVSQQSPRFVTPEIKTKLQNYIMLIEQN